MALNTPLRLERDDDRPRSRSRIVVDADGTQLTYALPPKDAKQIVDAVNMVAAIKKAAWKPSHRCRIGKRALPHDRRCTFKKCRKEVA